MTIALSYIEAGTIGTYSDLVEKVGLWLDRDDLDPTIPDFISLLEARLNRLLRTVNQEIKTLWTISAEEFVMPSDYRKMRKIHIEGAPDRPLSQVSPAAVPIGFSGQTGIPQVYWIEGRTISFAPPPAAETTFRVTYYTRIVPLTASEPVNWILTEHPDIYLWGVLHQAAVYIRDESAISFCGGYLDLAISELQLESRLDKWGGGARVPNTVSQVRGARC